MSEIFKIVVFILIIVFAFKLFKPDKYIGFYYPNIEDLTVWDQSSELESLEDCRNWVNRKAYSREDNYWDYECGKNCEYKYDWDMYVCEETLE